MAPRHGPLIAGQMLRHVQGRHGRPQQFANHSEDLDCGEQPLLRTGLPFLIQLGSRRRQVGSLDSQQIRVSELKPANRDALGQEPLQNRRIRPGQLRLKSTVATLERFLENNILPGRHVEQRRFGRAGQVANLMPQIGLAIEELMSFRKSVRIAGFGPFY
jgi:hypothetical protein